MGEQCPSKARHDVCMFDVDDISCQWLVGLGESEALWLCRGLFGLDRVGGGQLVLFRLIYVVSDAPFLYSFLVLVDMSTVVLIPSKDPLRSGLLSVEMPDQTVLDSVANRPLQ